MEQGQRRRRWWAVRWIIAPAAGGALVLGLVLMNLTPGHFGFADSDGCTCVVSYTARPSNPSCEATRPLQCDGLWLMRLLAKLSYLDLRR